MSDSPQGLDACRFPECPAFVLRVIWLAPQKAHGYSWIDVPWPHEASLSALQHALLRLTPEPEFPSHLLHDEAAFCRLGQALSWSTRLRGGDEIALLERITADAKARRHEKVRRQRITSGR
ncbi:MAG: hypothetical protein EBZ03_10840 [Betaproteobacteria bacterium]|nr:hypothetical protein [Pseudomonadota bacterium]NBP11314.1 hypothetical protein [Betaproteobacteria bacterium]NBP62101.1 hypothetical protein [Betaproteobacteria bacterium]NBQ09935.1 hypothetical protein [Betaproteobacteria bacterium]NBQ80667.1 hypothetical protein [Betaproteobacteria bacterium]